MGDCWHTHAGSHPQRIDDSINPKEEENHRGKKARRHREFGLTPEHTGPFTEVNLEARGRGAGALRGPRAGLAHAAGAPAKPAGRERAGPPPVRQSRPPPRAGPRAAWARLSARRAGASRSSCAASARRAGPSPSSWRCRLRAVGGRRRWRPRPGEAGGGLCRSPRGRPGPRRLAGQSWRPLSDVGGGVPVQELDWADDRIVWHGVLTL